MAAAFSYEAVGCAETAVASADVVVELAAFEVVDAAYADAAKFAAAVATVGFSAGAYQSTEPPPVALAPEPAFPLALTLALALAADIADADAAVALVLSLVAATVDPPAFASSRARVRSSAIFLRSASSSCWLKADYSFSYRSRSANASSFALRAASAASFYLLFSAISSYS